MVRKVLFIALAVTTVLGAPKTGRVDLELATSCDPTNCQLPNCRCFSTDIPGGFQATETPQVIMKILAKR